jgi:predicted nucleic acid-binding protein
MSDDPAFVDTNILVYAFDRSGSPKKDLAIKLLNHLLEHDRIRLSTQVLQELFVTLTRKVRQPCSVSEALGRLADLSVWPLFLVDYAAIRDAGLLCEEARLSFWDALVIVSAARSGAATLYTEDLNHGQRILGIRIVNPFRETL